jgi:hypothetical protein
MLGDSANFAVSLTHDKLTTFTVRKGPLRINMQRRGKSALE